MKRLLTALAWLYRHLPDRYDVGVLLGIALVAWTVYLLWTLFTPMFVGICLVVWAIAKDVLRGTGSRSGQPNS